MTTERPGCLGVSGTLFCFLRYPNSFRPGLSQILHLDNCEPGICYPMVYRLDCQVLGNGCLLAFGGHLKIPILLVVFGFEEYQKDGLHLPYFQPFFSFFFTFSEF